jgi:Domain of unknown function (DUF4277)/DDE superfamily endonuclease
MDLSNLNIKNLDHLGLVACLCQEVGISQIIDKLIPSSAIEQANCKLVFLTAYSPDLNPIEKFWQI